MQRRVNPKVVDEIWIFRARRLTRCDAKWNEATRRNENGVVVVDKSKRTTETNSRSFARGRNKLR